MLAPQEDERRREQRKARFLGEGVSIVSEAIEGSEPSRGVVVGVCSVVEKEYLRLTAAPDPANVRPLRILKMALKHVKSEWLANRDYKYALSQLKSIRQDITVQHLKGKFVVEVYETHGRIAIEEADLGELRQCLSQLELLYASGNHGNKHEFWAYKLLDGLVTSRGGHHNVEFVCFLQRLQIGESRLDPCVQHAQAVRVALAENNYVRFFQLWRDAPRLSGFLLDLLVDPLRIKAFRCMLAAYRPTLPLIMVQRQLGFTATAECMRFLKLRGSVMASPSTLDVKLSLQSLAEESLRQRQAEAAAAAIHPPTPQIAPKIISKKKVKRKIFPATPLSLPTAPTQKKLKPAPVITISSDESSEDENKQQLKKLKKKIKRKKPKLKSELITIKDQLGLVKTALEAAKGNLAVTKTLKKELLKLKKQKLQVKIALQTVKTALTKVG